MVSSENILYSKIYWKFYLKKVSKFRPLAKALQIELKCTLFALINLTEVHLDMDMIWIWFIKAQTCPTIQSAFQTKRKQSNELSIDICDQIVLRHGSG